MQDAAAERIAENRVAISHWTGAQRTDRAICSTSTWKCAMTPDPSDSTSSTRRVERG